MARWRWRPIDDVLAELDAEDEARLAPDFEAEDRRRDCHEPEPDGDPDEED